MKHLIASMTFVLSLLAGCAGLAQVGSPVATIACLPPGLAALPPASAIQRTEVMMTTAGPAILVDYTTPTGTMQVLWIDGLPIAIDQRPEDPAAPVWIRESLDGCHWTSEVVGARQT